jgi:1-deoxy-D-xylulose-5-phosphate synthase
MKYLPQINSPADLKKLHPGQLPEVAAELRQYIIDTVAHTGGHFGGPLGAVEICLALQYVLDTPKDKIVWDVGYQAYAHKILTGRRDEFLKLRQKCGLAPFPRIEESPYDTSNPGHGSTSISQALGYAVARDLQGSDETVVAVIGDGSLVGGLALEGLHHAGHQNTQIIVLLNDNEMGISHNYSSLATYLRRVRTDPVYRNTRQSLEEVFKKLPGGEIVIEVGHKLRAGVKSMVVPGMWFEELGYHYIGPINGHSFLELSEALKTARSIKGPVLIHAVTVKGKGFEKAEKAEGQIAWHAATPSQLEKAGFGLKKESPTTALAPTQPAAPVPTYTQVFSDTLIELAAKDEKIVAITAAMPGGTGIDNFIETFPARGFDVGMTEEHAVTFASGLALRGLHPVVAIYSTFLQRGYDQIIHDVCQHRPQGLPVTFALDRGGLVGEDGATHQGVFDLSYLRSMPNMVVMAPKDEDELRSMLATAVTLDGPSAVRYPRGKGVGCDLSGPIVPLPIGQGELLCGGADEEFDVAVLAIGASVQTALGAVNELRGQGQKIALVNARFVKPLDAELICSVARRSRRIITVEENTAQGGFGSAVLELLAHEEILLPVRVLGVPDKFIQHASQEQQRAATGLDTAGIAAVLAQEWAKTQTPALASAASEPADNNGHGHAAARKSAPHAAKKSPPATKSKSPGKSAS